MAVYFQEVTGGKHMEPKDRLILSTVITPISCAIETVTLLDVMEPLLAKGRTQRRSWKKAFILLLKAFEAWRNFVNAEVVQNISFVATLVVSLCQCTKKIDVEYRQRMYYLIILGTSEATINCDFQFIWYKSDIRTMIMGFHQHPGNITYNI